MLFRKIILFTILLATMFLNRASAYIPDDEYFRFKDNRRKQTMPFRLIKNLLIIPLTINGKGPYNFILDTGVGLCIITDPALIDTLKPDNIRNIKIRGFGDGKDINAFIAGGMHFELGHIYAKNLSAAVLKTDAFNLSALTGMEIHGLIGYEIFNSFIIKVNFVTRQLTFYRHNTAYLLKKGARIPITLEERKPYITTDIVLQGGEKLPVKVIIDTGAGHPISLETYNGLPFPVPAIKIAANLGIGLSGPIDGYLSRVTAVKLGKYKLNNVVAAFPDYRQVTAKVSATSRNGNMGNGILKRFTVVFDYRRRTLYLKPTIAIKEPFEHDMSGMEVITGGASFNRIFILRTEPDSPAALAGLQKDDEILSINFKPAREIDMEEVDAIMRSRDDRSIALEIMPKGEHKSRIIIITLKRRI